jgi:hypothetical protein
LGSAFAAIGSGSDGLSRFVQHDAVFDKLGHRACVSIGA